MSSALGRDLNAYQTCGEADTPSYRYSANVEIRWIDVEYIYIYISLLVGGLAYFYFPYIGNNHPN